MFIDIVFFWKNKIIFFFIAQGDLRKLLMEIKGDLDSMRKCLESQQIKTLPNTNLTKM